MNLIEWIIIGALVVVGLAVTLVILSFFTTWLKALLAKAPVGFPTLLAMRLEGSPRRTDCRRKGNRGESKPSFDDRPTGSPLPS